MEINNKLPGSPSSVGNEIKILDKKCEYLTENESLLGKFDVSLG